MSFNSTLPVTLEDHLVLLGGIPADRVRLNPPLGRAVMSDLAIAHQQGSLCELVDGTLVEKAMGYEQSMRGFTSQVGDFFADLDIGQQLTNDQ